MKGADRQSSERCEIRERERREVGREKERRLDGRAEGIDMKCLDVVDDEMHSPNVAVRSVLSDRKERKKRVVHTVANVKSVLYGTSRHRLSP